jgi:hypothetical protein
MALEQPLHRVQLDRRVEHGDEGIDVALVERADELSYRISSFHESEGAKTKQVGGCREGAEGSAL